MKNVIVILLMIVGYVNAEDKLEYHFGMTFGFGGETIETFDYDDGSSNDIKANKGFAFLGGVYYPFMKGLGAKAMVGYKTGLVSGSNGEASFSRIPIELSVVKEIGEKHRVSAGLTYHSGVKYSCELAGSCSGSVDFDSAVGGLVGYDFVTKLPQSGQVLYGVNYTVISYTEPISNTSYDGSGVNFYIGMSN